MSEEQGFISRVLAEHSATASDPQFEKAGPVHDWRNYASDEVRQAWPTLSMEVRCALVDAFESAASNEEWD